MIRVNFKKPQYMSQYYLMCECSFIICKSIEFKGNRFSILNEDDILLMSISQCANIKSIEHVKPSEL